jgi:cytochrome c oxidase subunit 2
VFEREACAGCHTIDGTGARGTFGPNLSDLGHRATLGSATLDNNEQNLVDWITNPGHDKPGVLMPPAVIPPEDVQAIAAYLESLR